MGSDDEVSVPSRGAEDDDVEPWLETTQRRHGGPPDWLRQVTSAARAGSAEHLSQLLVDGGYHLRNYWRRRGAGWPESPDTLFRRALLGIAMHLTRKVIDALPPDPPDIEEARRVQLRGTWLEKAASRWADDWGQPGGWPDQPVEPSGAQGSVRMTVLLVARHGGTGQDHGIPATLTLYRAAAPGARLALVAAPCSAVTPVGPDFQAGLVEVTAYLRQVVNDTRTDDLAIAWDLCPVGDVPLASVDGNSASAAFALGALWLLRELLPAGDLRNGLYRIKRSALLEQSVTAGLRANGVFRSVDFVHTKAGALVPLARALNRTVRVHVAQPQAVADAPASDTSACIRVEKHPDIGHLVAWLAEHALRLTTAQQQLCDILLKSDDSAPRPPAVDARTLAQVQTEPVGSLVQYLLHRWASWANRVPHGDLHCHFVPLVLRPDRAGLPPNVKLGVGSHKSLAEVLGSNDRCGIHAYKLHGPPDAGKSTLLQQHERRLCVQALREIIDGKPITELPLFLDFKDQGLLLPWEGDGPSAPRLLAAVQEHVRAQYKDCTELSERLAAPAGGGAPALRLLCDGLNEMRVDRADEREDRAGELVQALHSWVGSGRPMILSASPSFDIRFNRGSQAPLQVVPVQVLPWEDHHIRAYLALRFPLSSSAAHEHWRKLGRFSRDIEICRLPGHLARWCDLADDGHLSAACEPGTASDDGKSRSSALQTNRATLATLERTLFRHIGYARLYRLSIIAKAGPQILLASGALLLSVLALYGLWAHLGTAPSPGAPVQLTLHEMIRDVDSQTPVLSGAIHIDTDKEFGLEDVRVFVADIASDGRATSWHELRIASNADDQRGTIRFATVVPSFTSTGFVACLIAHKNGSARYWKVLQRFVTDQPGSAANLSESGTPVVAVRRSEQRCS